MIKLILFHVAFFYAGVKCYGQMPLRSEGFTKTEKGFIYYTDSFKHRFITFVPLKANYKTNNISDFSTKKLGIGYHIRSSSINLDSAEKYGNKFKINDSRSDSILITIIPMTITYTVHKYSMTESQSKEYYIVDKIKLPNKFVQIKSFAGLPILLNSSSPPLYIYNSPE